MARTICPLCHTRAEFEHEPWARWHHQNDASDVYRIHCDASCGDFLISGTLDKRNGLRIDPPLASTLDASGLDEKQRLSQFTRTVTQHKGMTPQLTADFIRRVLSPQAISESRLAETEYAKCLGEIPQTGFGRLIYELDSPRFVKLIDCRCAEDEVEALLETVEELYASTDIPFRTISGHDAATFSHLAYALASRGWGVGYNLMMPFTAPPIRPINPDVKIEEVRVNCPENTTWRQIREKHYAGRFHGHLNVYYNHLDPTILIGWLDSEPVGTTGWYVVDGVARHTGVWTLGPFQHHGVASTLIQYVQNHAVVQAQDALVIFCPTTKLSRLYKQLGYRTGGFLWHCVLEKA